MLQINDALFDPIARQYHADMLALATNAISGQLSQSAYRRALTDLATATTHATLLLSGADLAHTFTNTFWRQQQRIIRSSAWKISRDVANGRYKSITNLTPRIDLWTYSLGRAWHRGLIAPSTTAQHNQRYRWDTGQVEEHCATCLLYNGHIAGRQFWQQLALRYEIYPQGTGLDCGGWHCDCRLYRVR